MKYIVYVDSSAAYKHKDGRIVVSSTNATLFSRKLALSVADKFASLGHKTRVCPVTQHEINWFQGGHRQGSDWIPS